MRLSILGDLFFKTSQTRICTFFGALSFQIHFDKTSLVPIYEKFVHRFSREIVPCGPAPADFIWAIYSSDKEKLFLQILYLCVRYIYSSPISKTSQNFSLSPTPTSKVVINRHLLYHYFLENLRKNCTERC